MVVPCSKDAAIHYPTVQTQAFRITGQTSWPLSVAVCMMGHLCVEACAAQPQVAAMRQVLRHEVLQHTVGYDIPNVVGAVVGILAERHTCDP